MKLKIRMSLVKKVRFHFPEFEINTANYPELEGKTLDYIRNYIAEHGDTMAPASQEFDNLMQELELFATTTVLGAFPEESRFFVTAEDETEVEELI